MNNNKDIAVKKPDKTNIKIIRWLSLSFLIISFIGFIFNFIVYIMLNKMIISNLDISMLAKNVSNYVGTGFILIFIFHLLAIITVILELKIYKADSLLLSFIFFLSIVSLIMIFADFALLSDITKEYKQGILDGIFSEFVILYFSQSLHFIFYIFIIILLLKTFKEALHFKIKEQVLKDEAIFTDVQYIGIFTSVMGIAVLTALSLFTPLWAIRKSIILICILLILPYAMIVIYWLILKLKERITEWYDEKQFLDVTKASFISFLSSIIILAVLFLLQNLYKNFTIINVIWFPLYFFIALLIFSSTILYFYKKAGE